jgi:hypothetical protein
MGRQDRTHMMVEGYQGRLLRKEGKKVGWKEGRKEVVPFLYFLPSLLSLPPLLLPHPPPPQ